MRSRTSLIFGEDADAVVNPRDPASVKLWAERFAMSELALQFFMMIHGYRVEDLMKAIAAAHRGESEDRFFLL